MIYFPQVFYLKENRYVSDFVFIIQDWIDLVIQIFHQSKPFDNFTQRQVSILESDDFDLIQELMWLDNSLQLKGFGKNSGDWMEYHFGNCKIDFIIGGVD